MLGIFKTMHSLSNMKTNVILEGKYDLENEDDQIENDSIEKDEQNNNLEDGDEPTPDDTTDNGDNDGQEDQNTSNNDEDIDDDSGYGYDDNSGYDSGDSYGSYDDGFGDSDESNEPTRSIPDIKVLALTKQEQQLSNIRLLDEIKRFKRNVQNSINTISGIHVNSKEHNIIGDEVLMTLQDIIKDVDTFVDYRMSDVYETNVKIYLGLLERYSISMELYKRSYDTFTEQKR